MFLVHSFAILHKPYLKNDKVAIEESMTGYRKPRVCFCLSPLSQTYHIRLSSTALLYCNTRIFILDIFMLDLSRRFLTGSISSRLPVPMPVPLEVLVCILLLSYYVILLEANL